MPKKSKNSSLHSAKEKKNDEFYTYLTDIEKELWHYFTQLKWKTVFCNCDDPGYSDFFKYFVLQFKAIWLKKLITTHYQNDKPSYKLEVNTTNINQIFPYISNTTIFDDGEIFKNFWIPLQENWDFRSPECIELLKTSDIIITNPPFSLFREYVAQIMEYKKKFLIIWNDNSITYKEIFKLIKENKIWLWYWKVKEFKRPDNTTQKFWNVGWFTNLETTKRNEEMILYKTYNVKEYSKYDNYDAINVDKVKDIPKDYSWAMWVPITFLEKYNPNQFEIISSNDVRKNEKVTFKEHWLIKDKDGTINWKATYVRIVIRNKTL